MSTTDALGVQPRSRVFGRVSNSLVDGAMQTGGRGLHGPVDQRIAHPSKNPGSGVGRLTRPPSYGILSTSETVFGKPCAET